VAAIYGNEPEPTLDPNGNQALLSESLSEELSLGEPAARTAPVAFPLLRRPQTWRGRRALLDGARALEGRRRDAALRYTLAGVDLLAATMAVLAASLGRIDAGIGLRELLALPVLGLIARACGLYRRDEQRLHKSTLEDAAPLLQAASIWTLLVWVSTDVTSGPQLRAHQAVALIVSLGVLMLIGRALVRRTVRGVMPPDRCLVLGDAELAAALRRKFDVSFAINARVVGYVPLRKHFTRNGRNGSAPVPLLGSLRNLAATVMEHDIDRLIIASSDARRSITAMEIATSLGVKVSLVPRALELVGPSVEFDDVDGMTLIGVRPWSQSRVSCLLKRTIDVVTSVAALMLLSPLLALIALLIKLESPGPVLYRQSRIGHKNREFSILKFRSMVDGADSQKDALLEMNETEGLFKIANDPRVTAVGRVLRKTSLDELPQLWNVVRGEMSLVGPRPLVPRDDVQIKGWHRERLNVRPGMTGAWQILGSTRVPLEEMVKLDYVYATTWRLGLDLKILLRTLAYVACRRGA
jgi:exopolysaccharide biosynthesis polyprenyl glycosylphosphotransferase